MTNLSVLLIGDCPHSEPKAGRLVRQVQQTLVDGGAHVRCLTPETTARPDGGDAVVVVSRECNNSYSGAIKTLLDSLDARTVSGKPFAIISYGDTRPATTAADHLRVVVSALGGVPLADDVSTSLTAVIDDSARAAISAMVGELLAYPRGARQKGAAQAPAASPPSPPPAAPPWRPRAVEPARRVGFEPAVPVDGKVYEGIAQAVAYIKENYRDQNLSLDMVASAVFMSRYHFSRKFRQEAGRRFIDYLIMLRMTEARRLLLQTNWTITSIATEVGYRDLSNFERSFKKLFGIQPSQYRQRYAGPAPARLPRAAPRPAPRRLA